MRFPARDLLMIGILPTALLAATGVRAQDLTTVEIEAPAAEVIPDILAETLADLRAKDSIYNRKEQRLDLHDLEVIIPEAPQAQNALAEQPPPPETSVSELVNGMSMGDGGTLEIRLNRGLTAAEAVQRSVVCEPTTTLTEGGLLFATGNWFAAFSTDPDSAFIVKDPFTAFPRIPGRPEIRFCCDQIAQYDPEHDALIWFLQYVTDAQGNVIRLGVETGDDISGDFRHYYTFSPQDFAGGEEWGKVWFDYPAMTMSKQFLYLSLNAFGVGADGLLGTDDDQYERTVLVRMPLKELSEYKGFKYRRFTSKDFSLKPTFDGEKTMYAACHSDTRTLQVLAWPEDSNKLTRQSVTVQRWQGRRGLSTAPAPEPDGRDWLGRSDPRVVGGWSTTVGTDRYIGFAWNAAQNILSGGSFPFPHVRVAILKRGMDGQLTLESEPHIWNGDFAFAYPALSANSQGAAGVSVCYGGGSEFPSHAVGVSLPPDDEGGWRWRLASSAIGSHGPTRNAWGDYLSCLADGRGWVASGVTLEGGPGSSNMVPRVVRFVFEPEAPFVAEAAPGPDEIAREVRALRAEVESLRNEVQRLRNRPRADR